MRPFMKIAILVNTCDKFDDCWDPFFILWNKFGLSTDISSIYLNTERKIYTTNLCNVISLAVCDKYKWTEPHPPTWSWCLDKALESISEEFVLYMQEDYFLDYKIQENRVVEFVELMSKDDTIDCIHLTCCGIFKKTQSKKYHQLSKALTKDKYYVSCQAALWRKSALKELIREHESAWQFERWATKRAALLKKDFYVANPIDNIFPISYVFTGIIQGKWFRPTVELFEKNNIPMDFTKRGFYEGKYGKKEGRWFTYQIVRFKYLINAFIVRYFSPIKSLIEILKMRVRF